MLFGIFYYIIPISYCKRGNFSLGTLGLGAELAVLAASASLYTHNGTHIEIVAVKVLS